MIQIRTIVISVLLVPLVLTAELVNAQETTTPPFNVAVPVDSVATLFSELYGPNGLIVDSLAVLPSGETRSAHFNSDFQSNFVQFGTAIASRLVSVPLPSPASGFTYEFDPSLGVFSRTTNSFGPILAERADTIGGGRVSFGFAFQRFAFDTIEDLNLQTVPAVFTHDGFNLRGGRDDVVTTENSIHAQVNQTTAFLTYGVTDSIDVSISVPIINTSLTVVSAATVRRLGTAEHCRRAPDRLQRPLPARRQRSARQGDAADRCRVRHVGTAGRARRGATGSPQATAAGFGAAGPVWLAHQYNGPP